MVCVNNPINAFERSLKLKLPSEEQALIQSASELMSQGDLHCSKSWLDMLEVLNGEFLGGIDGKSREGAPSVVE